MVRGSMKTWLSSFNIIINNNNLILIARRTYTILLLFESMTS